MNVLRSISLHIKGLTAATRLPTIELYCCRANTLNQRHPFPHNLTVRIPDWKVCIAQPRSRLRNFGPSARPGAQILKIYFSGAQFEKVRMQNAIAQFLKRVERAEMEAQNK